MCLVVAHPLPDVQNYLIMFRWYAFKRHIAGAEGISAAWVPVCQAIFHSGDDLFIRCGLHGSAMCIATKANLIAHQTLDLPDINSCHGTTANQLTIYLLWLIITALEKSVQS